MSDTVITRNAILDKQGSRLMQQNFDASGEMKSHADGDVIIEGYLATPSIDENDDRFTEAALRNIAKQINEQVDLKTVFPDPSGEDLEQAMDEVRTARGINLEHQNAISMLKKMKSLADTRAVDAWEVIEAEYDGWGVKVRAKLEENLPDDIRSNIRGLVEDGKIRGFSLEYIPVETETIRENGKEVRLLKKVRVTGGATSAKPVNDTAVITSAELKSAIDSLPDDTDTMSFEQKASLPTHEPLDGYSTTQDEEWSSLTFDDFKRAYGYEVERFVDLPVSEKRVIAAHYGYVDADDIESAEFSDLKLEHHDPLADGDVSDRGVDAARQRLSQTDAPQEDLEEIDQHLMRHLRNDFDEDDVEPVIGTNESKSDTPMTDEDTQDGGSEDVAELKSAIDELQGTVDELQDRNEELKNRVDELEDEASTDEELKNRVEDLEELQKMESEVEEMKSELEEHVEETRPVIEANQKRMEQKSDPESRAKEILERYGANEQERLEAVEERKHELASKFGMSEDRIKDLAKEVSDE